MRSSVIAKTESKKFEQVLQACDECIEEIKAAVAEFSPSQKSLAFLWANVYIQKGRCLGRVAFHRQQRELGEQGLKLMEHGIRMTTFPPNARWLALDAYEALAENMGLPVPADLVNIPAELVNKTGLVNKKKNWFEKLLGG